MPISPATSHVVKQGGKDDGSAPARRSHATDFRLRFAIANPAVAWYRIEFMVFVAVNMVLRHLSINGHSRPVELLGGLADIPIRGDEYGKQRIALVRRDGLGFNHTAAELLGQVSKKNLLAAKAELRTLAARLAGVAILILTAAKVADRSLQKVLELANVARPSVAEQTFRGLFGKALDMPAELTVEIADIVTAQGRDILLAVS
jgi:hypothetical protein